MNNCGIYQIKNTINGKIYIGSSKNIHIRWNKHKNDLTKGFHHNIHLQRSFHKNGDVFEYILLESCLKEDLFDREEFWINKLSPSYNLGSVGGGDNLTNHPDREKIIEKRKATCARRVAKMSESERKERWAKNGEDNPNWKGGICSKQYTCIDCGANTSSIRGKRCQTCKSIGKNNAFYGKTHSKEFKDKLSRAAKERGYVGNQEKRVEIDGKIYKSCSSAAREIGVTCATICNRANHKTKFSNYKWV